MAGYCLIGMENDSYGRITEFLTGALAGSALGAPKLEAMARTAGLLGEIQHLCNAKLFVRAKKELGIRSVRSGFGSGGAWLWLLEKSAPPVAKATPEAAPRVISDWIEGLAWLVHQRAPAGIPCFDGVSSWRTVAGSSPRPRMGGSGCRLRLGYPRTVWLSARASSPPPWQRRPPVGGPGWPGPRDAPLNSRPFGQT